MGAHGFSDPITVEDTEPNRERLSTSTRRYGPAVWAGGMGTERHGRNHGTRVVQKTWSRAAPLSALPNFTAQRTMDWVLTTDGKTGKMDASHDTEYGVEHGVFVAGWWHRR